MPRKRLYATEQERHRETSRRRRERERSSARRFAESRPTPAPPTLTDAEKIALYRTEKAKWLERTAPERAELQSRIRAAVAKADAEDLAIRRGGRPKGSRSTGKNRGPSIAVFGRSKLDLLRESRPGGTL